MFTFDLHNHTTDTIIVHILQMKPSHMEIEEDAQGHTVT